MSLKSEMFSGVIEGEEIDSHAACCHRLFGYAQPSKLFCSTAELFPTRGLRIFCHPQIMTFAGRRKIEGLGASVTLKGSMERIDPLERGLTRLATANSSMMSSLSHDGIFARKQQTPRPPAEGAGELGEINPHTA